MKAWGANILKRIYFALLFFTAILFLHPALLNAFTGAQTYIIALAAACGALVLVRSADGQLEAQHVCMLLCAGGFMLFCALRRYAAGLYMLPVLSLLCMFIFSPMALSRQDEALLRGLLGFLYCIMAGNGVLGAVRPEWYNAALNGNTIGVFLFFCAAAFTMLSTGEEQPGMPFGLWVLHGVTAVLIWLVKCRTALLCLLLYDLCVLCRPFQKKPSRLIGFLVLLIAAGCVTPAVYVWLYRMAGTERLSLVGKVFFSGRQDIWAYHLHSLTQSTVSLLFGTDKQSTLAIYNNLHSLYLSILLRLGLAGALCYWSIFLLLIGQRVTAAPGMNAKAWRAVYMALCLLCFGFTETSYLWNMFFPFALLPFIMAAGCRSTAPDHTAPPPQCSCIKP